MQTEVEVNTLVWQQTPNIPTLHKCTSYHSACAKHLPRHMKTDGRTGPIDAQQIPADC